MVPGPSALPPSCRWKLRRRTSRWRPTQRGLRALTHLLVLVVRTRWNRPLTTSMTYGSYVSRSRVSPELQQPEEFAEAGHTAMTGDVLGSASIPLPRLVLGRPVRELSESGLRVIQFGVFELDLHAGELRKAGVHLSLPAQSFHVLALLLERPGDLVTREELRQRLWPTGTVVDFEHGLNAVVNRLRETLGDSADRPRFIETVPRRGYRFIGPVDSGPKQGPAADPRPSVWRAGSLMRPALVIALAMGAAVW